MSQCLGDISVKERPEKELDCRSTGLSYVSLSCTMFSRVVVVSYGGVLSLRIEFRSLL